MTPNNPAARLYDLLSEARRRQPEDKVRKVWGELFGVSPENTTELLQVHTDLLHLISDARAAVSALDGVDRELFLRPFKQIEGAFAQANLEIQWKQIRNQIDDATMARLEHVAETLGRMAPEQLADEDDLAALEKEVEELYDAVVTSKFPQQLKSAMLESLDAIRRAIRTYQIFGMKGLVDALTRSAGVVMMNQNELRDKRETKPVERFFDVLARLNLIVAVATHAHAALKPILDLVALGSGG